MDVQDIFAAQDPERQAIEFWRDRVSEPGGPNHIWACDGNDKLAEFGIHIYGLLDSWSQYVLGLFVHVSNEDNRLGGSWFLQVAAQAGGIPLQVSTNEHGIQNEQVAGFQVFLSRQHADITDEEASKRVLWTESTENRKIRYLWSKLTRTLNCTVLDHIRFAVQDGTYDPDDWIQKHLFHFLWIPRLQTSLDGWVRVHNLSRRPRIKNSLLPTACSPEFAYTTPGYFDASDHLVPFKSQGLDDLENLEVSDTEDMFRNTPSWFSPLTADIMTEMGFSHEDIDFRNIWDVFVQMLPRVQKCFCQSPDLVVSEIESSSQDDQSSSDSTDN